MTTAPILLYHSKISVLKQVVTSQVQRKSITKRKGYKIIENFEVAHKMTEISKWKEI